MNNKRNLLLLLLWLAALYFFFDYNHITGLQPQSFHAWRQADCASFALRYYHDGMHFFQPKVHNLLMGDGNCVGECPVIYYFVALLYKVFGVHDLIFRLVVLLFLLSGLISLNQLVKRITGDYFFAHIIPLLLFSSPVIAFFGNNFLSDVPSISCVFIALNFILKYKETGVLKSFVWGMFFFTLAAILKLNSAICFVALATLFFFEINSWVTLNGKEKLFRHLTYNILCFGLSALIILSWYLWAIHYNEKYSVTFLGTRSWPGWPIWEASDSDFVSTITKNIALSDHLFSLLTNAVIVFLFLFIVLNRQVLTPLLRGLFILCLTGCLIFYLTFFVGFRENTYYFINLMIAPVLAFICSSVIMKEKYPRVFHSTVFRAMVFVFLIFNLYHAKAMLRDVYYHNGPMHFRNNENFYHADFRNFLDSIGIGKNDKVISFPDATPNTTLYLIDRQGWSNYNFPGDSNSIAKSISNGAKYMVISDLTLLENRDVRMFANQYAGNYRNIFVYKLNTANDTILQNDTISLIASNNKRVSFNTDGEMNAKKEMTDTMEKFTRINLGNNFFFLTTKNKKHVSADMSNSGILHSPKDWVGDWEIFSVKQIDSDHVAIKACNNKYVHTDSISGLILYANSEKDGVQETFRIIK